MDPIVVTVSTETQQAAESIQALYEQAQQLGEGYSASVDKIEKKIFELTRTQQTLASAITATTERVQEYQRRREAASESEQTGIDASIKKEQALADQHTKNISLLESKIALLTAQKDAAQASTDTEKLGIQIVVQQRLIELQTIRDTTAAISAGDKASETALARSQAALDSQIAKQAQLTSAIQSSLSEVTAAQELQRSAIESNKAQIADYQTAYASANDTEKAGLDAAIAKENQLMASHQAEIGMLEQKATALQGELESSTALSNEHKAAIQQVTQARLSDLIAIQDHTKSLAAGDKAQVAAGEDAEIALEKEAAARQKNNEQFGQMLANQKTHLAIIDLDKQKIEELEAKKAGASVAEKEQIDAEIVALRKVITTRENELLLIEIKKVKLQEALDKSLATSDAEIRQAEEAAAARMIEIGAAKDLAAAENSITEAQEAQSEVSGRLLRQLTGFGAVILVAQQLESVFKQSSIDLEKAVEAAQKLRDINASVAGSIEPAYQAYNADEKTINEVVLDVMKTTGSDQDQVVDAMAKAAPYLNNANVAPDTQQGKGLIATTAMYARQGVSADATSYILREELGKDPSFTGQQLNQRLADLKSNFKSPQQFQEVLELLKDNGDKFQSGGIGTDETVAIAKTISQRTDPAAWERLMRQFSQSLIKNEGKKPEDYLEDFTKFGSYTEASQERLRLAKEANQTPLQRLNLAAKLAKPGTGAPQLLGLYQDAIKGDTPLDIGDVFRATAELPEGEREIVNRVIAGPRDVAAGYWTANYGNTQTTIAGQGTPLTPITSGPRTQQTEKDIAALQTAMSNPADPGGTLFNEAVTNAGPVYDAHIDDVPDHLRGAQGVISQTASAVFSDGVGYANEKERNSAYALGLEFMKMIRLRDQAKAPADKRRVQTSIDAILDRLEINLDPNNPDDKKYFAQFEAVAHGSGTDIYGRQFSGPNVLANVKDDAAFVSHNLPTDIIGSYGSKIADPKVGGELFRQAADTERAVLKDNAAPQPQPSSPTPSQPTTRPSQGSSPVSVNYHQRINNYGVSYDQIGAPQGYESRYS